MMMKEYSSKVVSDKMENSSVQEDMESTLIDYLA
jgi:hypothetical protein